MMPYPRVTEILKPFINFTGIPHEILANAAARGTSVHALCAGIARGGWLPDSLIPQEYAGYVTSFRKWVEKNQPEFDIVETRYRHEKLKYTGQVDFVAKVDGKKVVVDIKTSSRSQKTYPLQIAAYKVLLSEAGINVDSGAIVYLDKLGTIPKVHVMEEFTEHEETFMSALRCWHYLNPGQADE